MGREWQPGDVAVATMTTRNGPRLIRRRVSDSYPWEVIGGDESGGIVAERAIAEARPVSLVVIDPEDREQVAALLNAWERAEFSGTLPEQPMTRMELRLRTALREFANPTPPKPDEPTGLGAVVECDDGRHFVRMSGADSRFPWVDADKPRENAYNWETHGGLDGALPVRILGDGVTP